MYKNYIIFNVCSIPLTTWVKGIEHTDYLYYEEFILAEIVSHAVSEAAWLCEIKKVLYLYNH